MAICQKSKFTSKFSNCDSNEKKWKTYFKQKAKRNDRNHIAAKGDGDIEVARNALAVNAPAVLRALARIEADSIDVEVKDVHSDGSIWQIDNDIPFVDLPIMKKNERASCS